MDNYAIAEQLDLLSKLMDIHGENSFKAKSYASAAFTIEKMEAQLTDMPRNKIYGLRGIGDSVGKKVIEILDTGELEALRELINATPAGVLEMMNIKGLGPKKIHMLWKEMHIDTIDDLKEACMTNKLAERKGFGEKTQQKILESISFKEENVGRYMYAEMESFALALQKKLQQKYKEDKIETAGEFRRQMETIELLEYVTTVDGERLKSFFDNDESELISESDAHIEISANQRLRIKFHIAPRSEFYKKWFYVTGNDRFIQTWDNSIAWKDKHYDSEESIFSEAGLPFIPPYLREKEQVLTLARENKIPEVLQTSDIKGLIHSHSNWSDGAHTIEEMAIALIELGFEYLVISDHSKAAYYANGLQEDRIKKQHQYIDELNKKLAPFKIYKSIECDILSDGSLDYNNDVLSTFDLVIISIHSNQDMTEEKAMQRLLKAISNPYATILGHMTGRLLTRRKGYPVDHKTIIDACAEHNVVIEINANPRRLDMDWRWVDYALEKNILLSINPDAHTIDEFANIKYGVLVGQKGGLTPDKNLSSFSKNDFEVFLQKNSAKN